MFKSELPSVFYINSKKYSASSELSYLLRNVVSHIRYEWDELVFLCIGSDRITGDSLGPLVGHLLSRHNWPHIHVYGTLKNPVHALNLEEITRQIKARHPLALIIAIDASLGSKNILVLSLWESVLCAPVWESKELPRVGDIFITGIINVSGTFEHFLLQTTRLSMVVDMADSIARGILNAIDTAYS